VAWRRTSLRALRASLAIPFAAAVATGVLLLLLGAGSSIPGLVAYTFAIFALTAIVVEFARGTRARKALGASGWLDAFGSLVARNRRRYGGYVVHFAVVLLAIGVAGSTAYGSTRIAHLQPGQSTSIAGYRLAYLGSVQRHAANHDELRARLDVSRGGKDLGVYMAGKNRYFAENQTSNEVSIRTDWLRAEDLFMIGDDFRPDGSVYVKVLVHPLVNLIWLSGLVFLLGSLIALWPDAREKRRLAAHGEPALATP
jgi:cytochrome c-type biogenesis protein CcmF